MTTPLIIQETANHLRKLNIEPSQLKLLLSRKVVGLIADPDEKVIKKFHKICLDPNDAHVLAGASLSGTAALVSLDKKHLLTLEVKKALKPMLIQSPKEFWHWLGKKPEEF